MAAQRKYPEELRERAVKMVFEIREQDGKGAWGAGPGRAA
jgi:transposase-like protein